MKNLSTKEVNYIRDILSWELLSAKKCFNYANQETNPTHQKLFQDATNMHQQNYLNVLNYIEQVVNNGGGQIN